MQLDNDYWTDTRVQTPPAFAEALVSVRILDIEPLDRQFGVHPALGIPEELRDILQFDQMRLYAVLDGAKIEHLRDILEGTGLRYRSLYSGDTAEELIDVAPYLVELTTDSRLLSQTFTRGDAKQHWWDLGAVVFLQSAESFDDILKHLRKLVALRTERGTIQYLRFWDARILRQILEATSAEFPDPLHFFGSELEGSIKAWILPDPDADTIAIAVPYAKSPKGRLKCSEELMHVLRTHARDSFAASLITFFAPKFPKTIGRLDPSEQLLMMLDGIEQAKGLNITKRGPVTSFLEMRQVLGAGMVDDPMYPWIGEIVRRISPQNQMAATEAMVTRFADFTAKVNGAQNAHFHAALNRARATLDTPEESSYAQMLMRVYPEKATTIGPAAVQTFLTSLRDQLAPYPNLDTESIRAYILLSFFMGHRCADDPQYGWIKPALARSAAEAMGALDSPLVRKSKTWSDAILERIPKQ